MGGECDTHGGKNNACKNLVAKSEEKWPLERPRLRSEFNAKMDPLGIGWEGVAWIHLGQFKNKRRVLLNMVMNLRGFIKCEDFLE
jgi:hypothetical protein